VLLISLQVGPYPPNGYNPQLREDGLNFVGLPGLSIWFLVCMRFVFLFEMFVIDCIAIFST
jgi:hypothetical protein